MVEALEQQYLPSFIREVFVQKPSSFRKTAEWRLERARFAGREARLLLLGWRDRLPIQPQLAAPPPAPGIHLVLRGLTPGVYSGVNWIGLKEKRGPDRDCDHCYMQSRLEVQLGRHRRVRPLYRAGTHLHTDNDTMTDKASMQTSND